MKIRVTILFLIIIGFFLVSDRASAQKFTRHDIKTAFVHNFIRFVHWNEAKQYIVIGIIGEDEFTAVLKVKLANQKIGSQELKIIQFTEEENYANCDVLIIANDESIDCVSILNRIRGKNILSIGEEKLFCQRGGIINFIKANNGNFFFEINQSRAIQEKIQISSKLLRLALKTR